MDDLSEAMREHGLTPEAASAAMLWGGMIAPPERVRSWLAGERETPPRAHGALVAGIAAMDKGGPAPIGAEAAKAIAAKLGPSVFGRMTGIGFGAARDTMRPHRKGQPLTPEKAERLRAELRELVLLAGMPPGEFREDSGRSPPGKRRTRL